MGINFLIDTNIIIYILKKELPEDKILEIVHIIDNSFKISAISVVETLGWHKLNKQDRIIAEEFLKQAEIIDINEKIIELAVKIRQNNKIKTPDSIIAATAINNNLTLMTRNSKDFSKIIDLNIYNFYEK